MLTSNINVTIKGFAAFTRSIPNFRVRICEVFKNSRVYIGFHTDGLGDDNRRWVLNQKESKAFARLLMEQFRPVKSFADTHTRSTGCTSEVHAVLDALYELSLVARKYPLKKLEGVGICVLNGCVQDSLGHVVQLGSSSPETLMTRGRIQ